MKVSREQMKANRERILTEAGRLFRAKGFDAVGVAEVMQAAGLTHGGFYGHFSSKDDLIAQTVGHGDVRDGRYLRLHRRLSLAAAQARRCVRVSYGGAGL